MWFRSCPVFYYDDFVSVLGSVPADGGREGEGGEKSVVYQNFTSPPPQIISYDKTFKMYPQPLLDQILRKLVFFFFLPAVYNEALSSLAVCIRRALDRERPVNSFYMPRLA